MKIEATTEKSAPKKAPETKPAIDGEIKNEIKAQTQEIAPPAKSIWSRMVFLLILIPIGIYFYFGLFHITQFETADEKLWFANGRIQQYWQAVREKNWIATRINDKPGVTVALISGIALLFDKELIPNVEDGNRKLATFDIDRIKQVHYNFRIPILIFNGLFSIYLYWVIRKMTQNQWMGVFAATLILLQPILIGISQIVNPDALFWSFATALLFTYMAFLKTGEIKLFFLSIFMLGFTLASKYVGIIFFPFLLVTFLIYAFYHYEFWKKNNDTIWKKMLWRSLAYILIVAGGIAFFAFLMPATLVKTKYLAYGTYGYPGIFDIFRISVGIAIFLALDALLFRSRIFIFLARYTKYLRIAIAKTLFIFLASLFLLISANWMFDFNIFQVFHVPHDAGKSEVFTSLPGFKQFFLEARPLVFGLTPVVLIPVILSYLIAAFKSWKSEWALFVLSAFIPIFYLAVMEQNLLAHVRYSIILYPLVSVATAIFIVEFFSWGKLGHIPKIIVFVALVGASLPSLLISRPFYFNYTNDFLPKKYSIVDGWGYGGYEAAQYLNSLPNAKQLKVIADYTGVCQFFIGRCIRYTDMVRPHFESRWNNRGYDYFVISKKGFRRYTLIDDYPSLLDQKPVWELNIDGRKNNFVRILAPVSKIASLRKTSAQNNSEENNSNINPSTE